MYKYAYLALLLLVYTTSCSIVPAVSASSLVMHAHDCYKSGVGMLESAGNPFEYGQDTLLWGILIFLVTRYIFDEIEKDDDRYIKYRR